MTRITRAAWVVLVAVGLLAGYLMNPHSSLSAQRPSDAKLWTPVWETPRPAPELPSRERTMWPNQPSAAAYWSIDDIKKAHQTLADAERAGQQVDPNSALHDFPYWTRTHSMFLNHVAERGAGGRSAQQHMGYSQFVVIVGGSGTVVAGGQLVQPTVLTEGDRQIAGEMRGSAINGGETFTVGEGDMLSIPPNTPAQFTASASGGLTYMVMKVNAMLYPWDLIR